MSLLSPPDPAQPFPEPHPPAPCSHLKDLLFPIPTSRPSMEWAPVGEVQQPSPFSQAGMCRWRPQQPPQTSRSREAAGGAERADPRSGRREGRV